MKEAADERENKKYGEEKKLMMREGVEKS